MRSLTILSGVFLAASLMVFAAAPPAHAAGYCYDGEQGTTCGFISLQQCLDANFGVGTGTCRPDPMAPAVVHNQSRRATATPAQ